MDHKRGKPSSLSSAIHCRDRNLRVASATEGRALLSAKIYRDVVSLDAPALSATQLGRSYVAAIGIDRYRAWHRLHNAVSDAIGALNAFSRLGFEPVGRPLLDDLATGSALRRLVTDDLAGLGPNDSLVLFFAGHGHTVTRTFHGDASVDDGYIIPFDGDNPEGRTGTWLRLASWLAEIARLPAKHILVVLDACQSGIALDPVIRWRGTSAQRVEPLEHLQARRSRRIITSALSDQLAMDSGPVPGHSLFTGCMIEGLTGGLAVSTGQVAVTGSEIGLYVQRRVSEYPGSTQTPDFGSLELDDRGELVVRLADEHAPSVEPAPEATRDSSAVIVANSKVPARKISIAGAAIMIAALVVAARMLVELRASPDHAQVELARDVVASASGPALPSDANEAHASSSPMSPEHTVSGSGRSARNPNLATAGGTGSAKQVLWRLRSTPSGAWVFDGQGQMLGTTPLTIELPPRQGRIDMVLKREGYFDKVFSLDGALDIDRSDTLVSITNKNIQIVE